MKRPLFIALFALKLLVTALAVWFVAARVDLAGALDALSKIDPLYTAAAGVCALIQIWLASLRFGVVARLAGSRLKLAEAVRMTFIGGFFGQAFATFVSGDAMRIWLFARRGAGYRVAANAVLLDRVFGIAALVVLIALGLPALLDILPSAEMRASAVVVTAGFAGLIGGFIVLGWLIEPARRRSLVVTAKLPWLLDFAGAARHVLAAPAAAFVALLLGLAVQLLSVVCIYLLFRGMGLSVAATNCFLFIPFVMLIAMLPLSFAGWGLREGAMVAAFGLAGVASDITLAVSIAFGLVILITSLPGLLLWLTGGAAMPKESIPLSENSAANVRALP